MQNNSKLNEIIIKAGAIALKYFGKADVSEKAVGNILTNADLEVERFLRTELQSLFPNDGLIGEEYGVLKGQNENL